MPLDNDIVTVSVATDVPGVTRAGFGTFLVAGAIPGVSGGLFADGLRTKLYTEAAAADDDAAILGAAMVAEVKACFAQKLSCKRVLVGALAGAGWTADLAGILAENPDWFVLVPRTRDDAEILEAAAWIETAGNRIMVAQSGHPGIIEAGYGLAKGQMVGTTAGPFSIMHGISPGDWAIQPKIDGGSAQNIAAPAMTAAEVASDEEGPITVATGVSDTVVVKVRKAKGASPAEITLTLAAGTYADEAAMVAALDAAIAGAGESAHLDAYVNGSGKVALRTVARGTTASIQVTGGTAQSTHFSFPGSAVVGTGPFAFSAEVTAAEVAAWLDAALTGADADVPSGTQRVRIRSATTGQDSSVQLQASALWITACGFDTRLHKEDPASRLKRDGRIRTALLYHPLDRDEQAAASAWVAFKLECDPDSRSTTWAACALSGPTPKDLDATAKANLAAKNANHYGVAGGKGYMWPGILADGSPVDRLVALDWTAVRSLEAVLDLSQRMSNVNAKIPYDDSGFEQAKAVLERVMLQGEGAGHYVRGSTAVVIPKRKNVSPADAALFRVPATLQGVLAGAALRFAVRIYVTDLFE